MSDGIAYRSTHPKVLADWDRWKQKVDEVNAARRAMEDRYGRRLMVNRLGFGHGTRVVGFEQVDDDVDGQIIGDNGELRVPKKGPPYRTVIPNTRRQAGKDLAGELVTLALGGPELSGMPDFQLVGFHSLAPALFVHEGVAWARWAQDITDIDTGGRVDLNLWTVQPLSAYYAAREAHEQAEAKAS